VGQVKQEANEAAPDPVEIENGHSEPVQESNGVKHEEEADEEIMAERQRVFLIMGCVTLRWSGGEKQIELEWEGNTMNDGIADAVMAVLMTVESSPAAVKYSSTKSSHTHHGHEQANGPGTPQNAHKDLSPQDRFSRLCIFLEEQFGDNMAPIEKPRLQHQPDSKTAAGAGAGAGAGGEETKDEEESEDEADIEGAEAAERARLAGLGIPVPGLEIRFDKHVAKLWLEHLDVECANAILRDRVKAVVERAVETIAPLWTVRQQTEV